MIKLCIPLLMLGLVLQGCSSKIKKTYSEGTDTADGTETIESTAPGIDMGLSVNWADCNVGADNPEDFGCIVPLGNTEDTVQPVNTSGYISGSDKDIAAVKMGNGWRMPTAKEWLELINNCKWSNETLNGTKGVRITASNGNSIFLPACGLPYGGNSQFRYTVKKEYLCNIGDEGNYWCGSPENSYNMMSFKTSPVRANMMIIDHDYCLAVRAVHAKE